MNRPKVLNAQNPQMWEDIKGVFDAASADPNCRCVLLTGNGRLFTAGIDLQESFISDDVQKGKSGASSDAPRIAAQRAERPDVARRALAQLRGIRATQSLFNTIEECRVPVVAAIHRACLGAGVDMVCAADIRYCTADATFAIKEVMLGLAADVGTLQRMPKVMGSESLLRELAFTGRCVTVQLVCHLRCIAHIRAYRRPIARTHRDFTAEEAKEHGFVSRVFTSREEMCQRALETAQQIATNSPIAVIGIGDSTLAVPRCFMVACCLIPHQQPSHVYHTAAGTAVVPPRP